MASPKAKWTKPLAKDTAHAVLTDGTLIHRTDVLDGGKKVATLEARFTADRSLRVVLVMEKGAPPIDFEGGAWVLEASS